MDVEITGNAAAAVTGADAPGAGSFDDEGLLIASSGWDQEGWPELPNHSIAVFNRHTQELGFLQI